jgi:hypothetical protein
MNVSIHRLTEESENPPQFAVNDMEFWTILFCLSLSFCYSRTLYGKCFMLQSGDVISGETKYKPSTSRL